MFTKLQLVMLGVVVLQGANLNAMNQDKVSNSPRNPLSCSQEARKVENGDLATIVALKRPREVSNTSNLYYDSPCGVGRTRVYDGVYFHGGSPMAPYRPDYDFYPR